MLNIDFPLHYVTLCVKHEGDLLSQLLNNYLKRKQKKQQIGFLGPIPKPDDSKPLLLLGPGKPIEVLPGVGQAPALMRDEGCS